jgi:hypothetical protein
MRQEGICAFLATLFFSGIEKAETARILSTVSGSAGMMSFLQYSDHLFAACESYGLRLAMDSGAYTRPLSRKDIERYASVICALGGRCEWYAAPDHIGDQLQSNANYRFLLLLLPSHLHHKVLWIYQVGSPLTYLDEGLERCERIGVGGLVRLVTQEGGKAELISIAERIASRNGEPHYFGLGQQRALRRLATIHEGRFSCDSATWLVGAKYNRLIRNDGTQVSSERTGFDFAPAEILAQNVRTMKKWVAAQDAMPKSALALQLPLFR